MNSSKESWLLPVIKGVIALFQVLPLSLSLGLARVIGFLGYYLLHKKRQQVYANLRTAFAGQKDAAELQVLTRRVLINFCLSVVEFFNFERLHKRGFHNFVTLHGREHVEAAQAGGKGFIILAIHSGNWELASVIGGLWGVQYSITANSQDKLGGVGELLNGIRRVTGANVITVGESTKEIIRALKANEMLSLVVDQGGKEGVQVDFLNRKTSMSTGAIRLAMKYNLPVLPAWIIRNADGRHSLSIKSPLSLVNTGDPEKDVVANVQLASSVYEGLLREYPDEYMWTYKLYKYSSTPQIVVLNDGRVGHMRQGQAVGRSLTEVLKDAGKQPRMKEIDIAFRSNFLAKACTVYAFLMQVLPFLRNEGILKTFLTEASFESVMSVKADYIISTGSKAACVLSILRNVHLAKAIQVLTPGILPAANFDLNILLEHDKTPLGAKKILKTKVALSLVNPAYLKMNTDGLLRHYSHLKGNVRTKFALLLGGDTKGVVFDEAKMRLLLSHLKEAALHYNADILVSTSRRTSPAIEQIVLKELKNFERCALCIIANEQNIPQAVGGILGLADLVIVSGESISMVSEAVASRKKTIVFDPRGSYEAQTRDKYQQFALNLNEQGYLLATSVKDLPSKISQLMSHKIYLKALNDEGRLSKALQEII